MVSFWDAVKTTFTRDPRGPDLYPRRFVAGIVVRKASSVGQGEDRQRDYPSTSSNQQRRVCPASARSHQGVIRNLPLQIYSAPE